MKQYFVFKDGSQIGPLSKEDLINLKITKDTLVWFEGIETWIKAESVEELSICFNQTPPPPPIPIVQKQTKDSDNITKKKKLSTTHKIIIYVGSIVILACIIFIVSTIINYKYSQGKLEGQQQTIDEVNTKINEIDNNNKIKESQNKNEVAENFEKYFLLHVDYEKLMFGGLSNVRLTVTNNSKYLINDMVVNVNIYRSSGSYYKTIQGYIQNIQGHSSKTVDLESTNWGSKAEPIINMVTCNDIGLNYSVPYMDLQ